MVEVAVSDVNDNSPEFRPSDYVAKVRSRFPSGPGSPALVTVRAEDPDLDEAGQVKYELVNGGGEYFSVDETSGEITLARPLSPGRSKETFRYGRLFKKA